jgi:hypothetical protein
MRKGTFTIVVAVVLAVAVFGNHEAGIFGLLFLGGAYWVSLIVHPRTRHVGFRSCNGTGEHHGFIFSWSHRRCPRCDGGRMIRAGAGTLGTSPVRDEYTRRRQARRAARNRGVWR